MREWLCKRRREEKLREIDSADVVGEGKTSKYSPDARLLMFEGVKYLSMSHSGWACEDQRSSVQERRRASR